MSFWMEPGNRLQNANGAWGQKTFYYDGVGMLLVTCCAAARRIGSHGRSTEITTVCATTTTDSLGYPATSNRVVQITRGATTLAQLITPTADARTRVDRPLAVVNAVNTASPATYYVHVDHLNRPVMMTDGAKANVWAAVWRAVRNNGRQPSSSDCRAP